MIARHHGFRHTTATQTTIDLYPPPQAYRSEKEATDEEAIWEWMHQLCRWAKLQFPTCTFSPTVKMHLGSKLYVSVAITSKSSAHEEAASWLEYNSLSN